MMADALKMRRTVGALTILAPLLAVNAANASTEPNSKPAIVLPDALLGVGQSTDAPIDVKFVTAPDTKVDLGSLHVWVHRFIGWIDVTQRLLSHPKVHVGTWGIHVDGGVLPAGEHLVRVSFQDLKGRAAEAVQTIRIAEGNGRM